MDANDENIEMLCSMGFHRESAKQALRMGKNDLNEAVAILTGDHPTVGFDTLYNLDNESYNTAPSSSTVYGPTLPPSYDEVVESDTPSGTGRSSSQPTPQDKEETFEFPVPNLYELENRVFTESWSIPYKREESLGKCLLAATRLAQEGLCDTDPNCRRFLERCMPEAFNKLLTSAAVHRWGIDIQEGIFDMLQLLIDLIATRLQHDPIPVELLHVLAVVFNMESEYNTKNRQRMSSSEDRMHWEDTFGVGKMYAISSCRDSYGWLTDLINRFAEKQGFQYIKDRLSNGGLDAPAMAALLVPFGNCVDVLNAPIVQPMLADGMKIAFEYARSLDNTEFKDKKVGSVCDMLATMKLICLRLSPEEVQQIDDLRFSVILRMLKSPHFNARMNALKEVTKLIEDSKGPKILKSAISQDCILDWLVDEKVLSIALEGNIDQVQYCDKIKNIVEFLGTRLSTDELTKIWNMQSGEPSVVVDNIHSIVVAAAVRFNQLQIEHLVTLVKESWDEQNDVMREKLLRFIGGIGRESKNFKTAQRLLEFLWELSHLPTLKISLVELALDEHLAILSDPFAVKELVKKQYAIRCVEDIREGKWVLPALKQLLQIAKVIAKSTCHKAERGILQELNKNYDIIKQVTLSLTKFHAMTAPAPLFVRDTSGSISSNVDGRYTHQDFVNAHLSFLQFILQEGGLYLQWHRAREIWDTLIGSAHSTDWDRDTCYEWFTKGIADLEQDTQAQLFQKEILKLDLNRLTMTGFACFKCFFESVNQNENKLKKTSGNVLVIEKMDLIGLDFLWKICMNVPDGTIAESAILLLLNVSYVSLAPRFKRDASNLHKKFIDECYNWLEAAMIPLEGSMVSHTLLQATKILTAVCMPQGSNMPSASRSANLLNIERLLLIAERYVVSVEELHVAPRSILPHGASFQGQPLNLNVACEAHKREFAIQAHNNESVGSLRNKISRVLKLPPEQIQFLPNEKMPNKDHKLLSQMDFDDNQLINVRIVTTLPVSSFSSQESAGAYARMSLDLEEEKMLPGVIMSNGGQVFEKLYQLASLDQPRITTRARSLLRLIPTDPSVVEALDSVGQKNTRASSSTSIADKEPSPRLSPHASPRRLFGGSSHTAPQTPPVGSRGASPTASTGSSTLKGSSSTASLGSIGSLTLQRQLSPKEILKTLLSALSPGVSMFHVLYNLEVLSSRLMPNGARDQATVHSARRFCEDFLEANGLSLILNILQKDAIRPEVDYDTRQGCYVVSLQLLRYLLCGQDVTGEAYQMSSHSRRRSSDSFAGSGHSSGPPSFETTQTSASRVVQNMTVAEFTDTVSCFIRVAWAAAAGKLHLIGSLQPMKDPNNSNSCQLTSNYGGREASIGSIGSGTSSGSENDLGTLAIGGVYSKQKQVSSRDTYIATEALKLLVTCLQLRSPLLAVFYNLPNISDFIIDVVVTSTQDEIRDTAVQQFLALSQTVVSPSECTGHQLTPRQFLLQTLLKARLPFWVSSTVTRGASLRLLRQCRQFFELKCRIMGNLTESEQESLQLNVRSMLEDEIGWLVNFVPSEGGTMSDVDNSLLAGHLQFIRTLLSCSGIDKNHFGKTLVHSLLHEFLFPSSKIIMDSSVNSAEGTFSCFTPKCSKSESRVAAYEVLVELANNNIENLTIICHELVRMHHQPNPELANEWDYMPPVDSRSSAGFVGLKNGGATCYMNSLLQQLYMMPGIAESILSLDDENISEDSLLYQVQQVLGHLMESKLQYYIPERFWQVFRLWGNTPVNIREQQDALDFFQAFIDQVDEQVKKIGKEPVFKKNFQGFFSDQKICRDCPHRYEQEEVFFSLNVTVKNATLQDSLDQFVKGELLEGSNAYFCEKCGVKRNAVKRLCIKTLPPVLCIQLKRFDYDWELNRAIKFDDYFKFPLVLDMEPYTAEGMAWREMLSNQTSMLPTAAPPVDPSSETSSRPPSLVLDVSAVDRADRTPVDDSGFVSIAEAEPLSIRSALSTTSIGSSGGNVGNGLCVPAATTVAVGTNHINYELVGIVVHSGQANAGHYYSFIKDRRGNYMTNPNKGKWYRFNDTMVEEFEMNEESLESECFGGKYKAKVYDSSNSTPEERLRYWNGYLLFYERMEEVRTPVSAKKSKVTMWRPPSDKSSFGQRQDSLKQLTELVHKGEKKGLFGNKMPARIQQVVREENLLFLRNRNVYDSDYFTFVRNLAGRNLANIGLESYTRTCLESLQLSTKFLFNTYFHTKSKLRTDLDDWCNLVTSLLLQSKETCMWMVDYLALDGNSSIKPLLLECSTREIREAFGRLLERTMASFFQMGGIATSKNFSEIVEVLLAMLQRDVPDHCKQSQQYFQVLLAYVQMGIKACSHMFGRNGFKRLMEFLIGEGTASSSAETDTSSRRWSSLQSRDFGQLHATLATLILNCDVAHARTEVTSADAKSYQPRTVVAQKYLKMSPEMDRFVFGPDSVRYLREVVHALREVTKFSAIDTLEDMLCYLSFNNARFTFTLIRIIMTQCTVSPCNELKPLFRVLLQLMLLEDEMQMPRLKFVIDGRDSDGQDERLQGMLAAISHYHTSESRRSYQIIKFLVSLANKCPMAKDYLLMATTRWQWAVNWLKSKMNEHYWSSQTAASMSNEDSTAVTFQRTMSAQDTLAEATALLTEIEAQDAAAEMDTAGGSSGKDEDSNSPVFTTEPFDELDSTGKHM